MDRSLYNFEFLEMRDLTNLQRSAQNTEDCIILDICRYAGGDTTNINVEILRWIEEGEMQDGTTMFSHNQYGGGGVESCSCSLPYSGTGTITWNQITLDVSPS